MPVSVPGRRSVLIGVPAVILSTFALGACHKAVQAVGDDASLGDPKAPVKVVEYASVACPVCGRWYREVFGAFKAKYIDTGKVYYTFREMLVGDATEQSMAAAGFLLARCAGRDKYFPIVDAIFQGQNDIYNDPRAGLLKIAQANGLGEKRFTACVNDAAALTALNNRVQNYVTVSQVNATPTFVINGSVLEPGYHSLAELDAAIATAKGGK
ncbi:MAG TPA: thioredoxin domain-containing protein [Caulobacteraceae bacterium]|nr:thioredoxin domain-containing protein [Caulobacteraceae bacterium]